jgi:hypothetical protein
MDNTYGLHRCNICNKVYSSYKSLWNHNNKFHNNIVNTSKQLVNTSKQLVNTSKQLVNTSKHVCVKCNKILSCKQSKWRHDKTCKNKEIINNNIISELQLKNEIEELKKQLKQKSNGNKINNINNTNNGTINNTTNNIVINAVGKESVSTLSANEIYKLSKMNINAFTYIIELLNFNKKRPENHNFCMTSLEGNYMNVYNEKTKKVEKKSKKDFLTTVLNNATRKLEEIAFHIEYDMMGDKNLDNELIKIFEKIAAKSNDVFMNYKKAYENRISALSYNNKEMVLNTMKNRHEANEDDFSSVSTYEYAIYPDSKSEDSNSESEDSNSESVNSNSEEKSNI